MMGTASVFQNGAVPSCHLWQSTERFCVLDTCLGDASDFLTVKAAWKAAPESSRTLHYVALCGASFVPPTQELESDWPLPLDGHHQVALHGEPNVRMSVVFGESNAALHKLAATFDLILLKPGITIASDLARVSRHGTALCLRFENETLLDSLHKAGFALEREATGTSGCFRGQHHRTNSHATHRGERSAIIIGAGLAGTAAAASLSNRGWNVALLEKHPVPAKQASGNLSAVISPMLSKDDGVAARLSRASFFSLLSELQRYNDSIKPAKWSSCGLLQMARDDKEEHQQEEMLSRGLYPPEYVRFLKQEDASHLLGWPVPAGGLYFPRGGWMNPLSLCHARLQSPNIKARFNADVSNIEFENGLWQTFNAAGDRLCEAPVLILANAFESSKFRQSSRLHFKKVRGQVTHVPAEQIPLIQQVVSRDGYLTPSFEGLRSVGATYDFDSDERSLDAESQQKNLARLSSLLNGVMTPSMGLSGRVGFRSLTADRLPVVGMMPDFESVAAPALNNSKILRKSGLYALLGLGSRGAVWSTLAGEILAAMIEGEPAPVSGDLLSAIDPARFLARTKST